MSTFNSIVKTIIEKLKKIGTLELSILLTLFLVFLGITFFPLELKEEAYLIKNANYSDELINKWRKIDGKYKYIVILEERSSQLLTEKEYLELLNLNKDKKYFLVKNDSTIIYYVNYDVYPTITCLNIFELYLGDEKIYCVDFNYNTQTDYPIFFINKLMLTFADEVTSINRISYANQSLEFSGNISKFNEVNISNNTFYTIASNMWTFILDKDTAIPIAGYSTIGTLKLEYYLVDTNDKRMDKIKDILLSNLNMVYIRYNLNMSKI